MTWLIYYFRFLRYLMKALLWKVLLADVASDFFCLFNSTSTILSTRVHAIFMSLSAIFQSCHPECALPSIRGIWYFLILLFLLKFLNLCLVSNDRT